MRQILCCILLCSTVVNSQKPREIKGRLLNANQDIGLVTVLNANTSKGTVTTNDGVFYIDATVGDTLMVNALQFTAGQFTITQKIYDAAFIEIVMTPALNELEEVQLSHSKLSGNLDEDVEEVELVARPKVLGGKITPIAVEYRRLHTATSRPSDQVGRQNLRLDVSLDGIINKITGKTKRLKKAIEIMEYQKKVDQVRNYYADAVFVSSLQIPQEYIDDFTFWVLKDEEQTAKISLDNKLSTLEYLLSRRKEYKRLLLKQGIVIKDN